MGGVRTKEASAHRQGADASASCARKKSVSRNTVYPLLEVQADVHVRPKGWRLPVMVVIAVFFVSFSVYLVYDVVGGVLG